GGGVGGGGGNANGGWEATATDSAPPARFRPARHCPEYRADAAPVGSLGDESGDALQCAAARGQWRGDFVRPHWPWDARIGWGDPQIPGGSRYVMAVASSSTPHRPRFGSLILRVVHERSAFALFR